MTHFRAEQCTRLSGLVYSQCPPSPTPSIKEIGNIGNNYDAPKPHPATCPQSIMTLAKVNFQCFFFPSC